MSVFRVAKWIPPLKIFAPEATNPIHVKGMLRWVKQGEKDFVGGVEVVLQSDKEKLAVLIGLILGLQREGR